VADRWATFDCYGTLIDWNRGIAEGLTELWPDVPRDRLLERYHQIEPDAEADGSLTYREVLTTVVQRFAREDGLPLAELDADVLARNLPHWPPFAEVPAILAALGDRGWRIGILSNTDPDFLASSMMQLGIQPDVAVTASEIGSYKPAPGHWLAFRARSGADEDRHVHVAASLFHDIAPAAELDIPAVWINRLGETSDLPRAAELPDLSALPETLDRLVEE